jgi:L-arabinose isomerase
MSDLNTLEVWFVTGSQHLYGDAKLREVLTHSNEIASAFSNSLEIPVQIVGKPVLTTPDAIHDLCVAASASRKCIGVMAWMHTFSSGQDAIRFT